MGGLEGWRQEGQGPRRVCVDGRSLYQHRSHCLVAPAVGADGLEPERLVHALLVERSVLSPPPLLLTQQPRSPSMRRDTKANPCALQPAEQLPEPVLVRS